MKCANFFSLNYLAKKRFAVLAVLEGLTTLKCMRHLFQHVVALFRAQLLGPVYCWFSRLLKRLKNKLKSLPKYFWVQFFRKYYEPPTCLRSRASDSWLTYWLYASWNSQNFFAQMRLLYFSFTLSYVISLFVARSLCLNGKNCDRKIVVEFFPPKNSVKYFCFSEQLLRNHQG